MFGREAPAAAESAPLNPPANDAATQPVVAGGRVFVGLVGTKQVVALDANTGPA